MLLLLLNDLELVLKIQTNKNLKKKKKSKYGDELGSFSIEESVFNPFKSHVEICMVAILGPAQNKDKNLGWP